MRNSDTRVRIVFVHRFNSNFHSIFTLQVAGCDFKHGSIFGVPSNPALSGHLIFHLVAKCYSRQATESVNCESSSVSFVMKYCPTSTVFRNPASVQISSFDLVVEAFPLVLCASPIDFPRVWVSLSRSLLARKVDQIALPQQVSVCLFVSYRDRIHTLHISPRRLS